MSVYIRIFYQCELRNFEEKIKFKKTDHLPNTKKECRIKNRIGGKGRHAYFNRISNIQTFPNQNKSVHTVRARERRIWEVIKTDKSKSTFRNGVLVNKQINKQKHEQNCGETIKQRREGKQKVYFTERHCERRRNGITTEAV